MRRGCMSAFLEPSHKQRKATGSVVLYVCSLVSGRLQLDGFFFFNLMLDSGQKSIKMRQKYQAIFRETSVCFKLFSATYATQQHAERFAVLPWQRFRYLLHCWPMYDNETKGQHSCISVATTVTRKRHSITLYVHCLPSFLFLSSRVKALLTTDLPSKESCKLTTNKIQKPRKWGFLGPIRLEWLRMTRPRVVKSTFRNIF
jgi:hypothetical protein